jgi:hypothetical protein
MKVKFLAAAVAALGTVSTFAAPLPVATTTPQNVLYIGGASAQKAQVAAIVPGLFATPADVVAITVNGALLPAAFQNAAGTVSNTHTAWLGVAGTNAGTASGQSLLVIYNNTNGSAAGINQLLSTGTPTEVEANVLKMPDATCVLTSAASPWTATCTNTAAQSVDLALSDVQPTEFQPGVLGVAEPGQPAGTYQPVSNLTVAVTALEGFGVIVNQKLYSALQADNVNAGLLPSTCAPLPVAPSTISVSTGTIVTGAACQPSIRSTDYGAIATQGGAWGGAEASALVPSQASALVSLCRRDVWSGTQAASNIFFLNAVCGLKGYFGALTPAGGTNGSNQANTTTASLIVSDNSRTDNAEACVKTATGYGMGVVGLGEVDEADATINYNGTKGYYYVKIDGASPNFFQGAPDAKRRIAVKDGNYKFATDMTAMYVTGTAAPKSTMIASLIADLTNSAKGNNTGLANIDNPFGWGWGNTAAAPNNQEAKYDRKGNNCGAFQ